LEAFSKWFSVEKKVSDGEIMNRLSQYLKSALEECFKGAQALQGRVNQNYNGLMDFLLKEKSSLGEEKGALGAMILLHLSRSEPLISEIKVNYGSNISCVSIMFFMENFVLSCFMQARNYYMPSLGILQKDALFNLFFSSLRSISSPMSSRISNSCVISLLLEGVHSGATNNEFPYVLEPLYKALLPFTCPTFSILERCSSLRILLLLMPLIYNPNRMELLETLFDKFLKGINTLKGFEKNKGRQIQSLIHPFMDIPLSILSNGGVNKVEYTSLLLAFLSEILAFGVNVLSSKGGYYRSEKGEVKEYQYLSEATYSGFVPFSRLNYQICIVREVMVFLMFPNKPFDLMDEFPLKILPFDKNELARDVLKEMIKGTNEKTIFYNKIKWS
jgi:hypothetical protein